jgi:ATP/maltotriose-dependent transcriptional regulator MalT
MAAACQPMVMGWGHLRRGDVDAARALLEEALDAVVRGQLMFEPMTLILLAQAHAMAGDPDSGLAAASRAHAIAVNEMPFHAPEAGRVIGELLLATGRDHIEALAALREASGTAARHGNVVHELRARTSLLRAVRRHDHAKVAAEEETLRAVCDGLTPGSQLAELQAARAELAADRPSTY